MSKKKKHDEEHIDETWLIPYADLLTLLLALFIVLFASSSIDAKKFDQMSNSLSTAFESGSGIMDYPSPVSTETQSSRPPEEEDQPNEQSQEEKEMQELEKLKEKIDQYIADKNLQKSLQTKLTQEGLIITILDGALFASGSATVKEDAQTLAIEISNLLVTDPPRRVNIAGHTDNVPINTLQFRSNWDLSVMRAVNFMKTVLQNDELEPHRFSSTGYGEHQPVASNSTAEGRAKNRRVEVLILPNRVQEK